MNMRDHCFVIKLCLAAVLVMGVASERASAFDPSDDAGLALKVCADERVFPPELLNTESSQRQLLAMAFPKLDVGFYHFTGRAMIGVLEDFEHERILLVLRHSSVAKKATFVRNGKKLERVPREAATIKIGRQGGTDAKQQPQDVEETTVGFWLPLAAEDTLSMDLDLQYPEEGSYHAFYSPDTGWRTKADLTNIPHQDRHQHPADVYEVTRKPLLEQVRRVLREKDECVVRKPRYGTDLEISRFPSNRARPGGSLSINLSDQVQVDGGATGEVLDQRSLARLLEIYTSAAMTVTSPTVFMLVSSNTQDEVFRQTIGTLRDHWVGKVYLIDRNITEQSLPPDPASDEGPPSGKGESPNNGGSASHLPGSPIPAEPGSAPK